jgi:hypothetical protein
MITADQLLAHLVGDYILQSDYMANEKTKKSLATLAHVLTYAIPFLFLHPSLVAITFIISTHFIIDRWRLARYVVWAKNWMCPFWIKRSHYKHPFTGIAEVNDTLPKIMRRVHVSYWSECSVTGYPTERPVWLATWLLIIADNIMHIILNGIALRWL